MFVCWTAFRGHAGRPQTDGSAPSISLPRILFPDRVRAHLKAAAEAQKAELEETIQKLMADGVSAAEILEKLK